jgi:hypothetical protein
MPFTPTPNGKMQPWKPFASQFGNRVVGLITYDAPKGAELRLNGTTGEMSMNILYDTGIINGT